MKFIFTYHAQYRMDIRNISVDNIKDIIRYPDFSKLEENGKILKVKYIAGKGKVAVVYIVRGSLFNIITIYYEY